VLSRQDWGEVRGAGRPPPENFEKLIAGKAFQALSSQFEGVGISKKTAWRTGF